MKVEEYKQYAKFMADMLHRSRRVYGCYNDLILVVAKLLESFDPREYLGTEEAMRNKVNGVLDGIYNKGQQRLKGGE